jgi:hypothetical protein
MLFRQIKYYKTCKEAVGALKTLNILCHSSLKILFLVIRPKIWKKFQTILNAFGAPL